MNKPVIVCVDDEKFVLDSLRTTLSQAVGDDYVIEIAEDGTDALEIVKELLAEGREVPLIISDYVMPLMRGDELLRHIQIVSQKTLKIMLTGQANIEGVTNAVNEADLYRFIAKPWNSNQLVEIVRQAVREFFAEKEREDRSRALLEVTPDRVYFIRRSDGLVEDYRGPAQPGTPSPIGRLLGEIFPAPIAARFHERIEALSPGSECAAFEFNLAEVGDPVFFEVRLTPCGGDTVLAVARDVSANKATERALKTSESTVRAAFDNAPFEFWTTDPEGRCLLQNSASEQRWGRFLGRHLGDPDVPAGGFGAWAAAGQRALDGEVVRRDFEWTEANGKTSSFFQVLAPIHSGAEVLGVLGFSLDVSDRKRAEETLRTAKTEAEQANRAKSSFLSAMSHEIRTPLNSVIGFSNLLLETTLSHEQLEFTDTLHKSAEALLSVVNDILDFSKIEAGRIELEKVSFNVREAVDDCLALVMPDANRKRLEVCALIDDRCPELVLGDVTRLRQVLTNLLTNAVKFTERGEIDVSVQLIESAEPGTVELGFQVRDTGIGMSPEQAARILEPFMQADASTTRRFGGTGLGLAISLRLTELMGGTISIASEPGEGSTFRFTVRMDRDPDAEKAPPADQRHPLAGFCVVVVDDNATNRRYLSLQMESWGASTLAFESGQAALTFFREGGTGNVVLMDFHMPGMDGVSASKALRELPNAADVPIFLLSSGGISPQELPAGLYARVFTKPVSPRLLKKALSLLSGIESPERLPEIPAEMAGRHPLRILLAEDNTANQKLASLMLARLGYRAEVVGNGHEAIAALRARPYDVVLMDVQMPDMDGLEATQLLRETLPREAQPEVIALTAHASKEDRELCLESGMDDYLTKPLRPDLLVEALVRASTRRSNAA